MGRRLLLTESLRGGRVQDLALRNIRCILVTVNPLRAYLLVGAEFFMLK